MYRKEYALPQMNSKQTRLPCRMYLQRVPLNKQTKDVDNVISFMLYEVRRLFGSLNLGNRRRNNNYQEALNLLN